jgi:hypothetical protein
MIMKIKHFLLAALAVLGISAVSTAQCKTSATINFSAISACSGGTITVSGVASLLKANSEGFYQPCGGVVSVQLQKEISAVWTNVGSPYITSSNYSFGITSANYGTGKYRVYTTNPSGNCSCVSTLAYASAGTNLAFVNANDNSYSINGTPTFNSSCISVCDTASFLLDNIVMTNPNPFASYNRWRVGVALPPFYTTIQWSAYTYNVPPATYDIATLLTQKFGALSGSYGIYLETYNGCNTISHFSCANITYYAPPSFLVGQKYDATNYNTISAGTTCSSPYTNICPGSTAPYSYVMTGANSTIPAYQITNGQWSCMLEEVPTASCNAALTLVFNKPYTSITSMSGMDNIDLNTYATTYGSKPANYVATNSNAKRWKFTLKVKYSCGNEYVFVCWLRYTNAGCRMVREGSEEANESLTGEDVILFPNPATNSVEIKSESRINTVDLYDLSGKLLDVELKNNRIDISHLSPGVYMIKIKTGTGIMNKKFIKQN